MWRLSAAVRLVGLVLYALGLAVLWTLWGALILVGMLLAASFRLVGVSLVGFERIVAAHRYSWRSVVRVLPKRRAAQAQAALAPVPIQGDTGGGTPWKEASDVRAPRESRPRSTGATALRGGRGDHRGVREGR